MYYVNLNSGPKLGEDFGAIVSSIWLTSPYFSLREKFNVKNM